MLRLRLAMLPCLLFEHAMVYNNPNSMLLVCALSNLPSYAVPNSKIVDRSVIYQTKLFYHPNLLVRD